jgi:hypothetical protein
LDGARGTKIGEPWRSAWRLIEESWNNSTGDDLSHTKVYDIKHRLEDGDRSGITVAAITQLVAPRPNIESFSNSRRFLVKRPKHVKSVEQLFSVRLTSGRLIDPHLIGLQKIADVPFFGELANALDAVVVSGLDIARRFGWSENKQLWRMGHLHRVYYVAKRDSDGSDHDPDEFERGIAPSVKLLHYVVSHLAEIDLASATRHTQRWKQLASPLHLRLWAAISRDSRITVADEVAQFLLSAADQYFWDQNINPEIAEVRALRFAEFSATDQRAIIKRIRKRPPRSQWPRSSEADLLENARTYWAVRELRRIQIAGATLPALDNKWLSSEIGKFPELANMSRVDDGFMGGATVQWVSPKPDARYDLMIGEHRLKTLESALTSARIGWNDDPAERASDWIRQKGNYQKILADLETLPDGGSAFAKIWNRFGWAHSPIDQGNIEDLLQPSEIDRVLLQLIKLQDSTISNAIDGISNWLSTWKQLLATRPDGLVMWHRVWPLAVRATNERKPTTEQTDLQTVARTTNDKEPLDLDTLNTPAAKLVDVFYARCPTIHGEEHPFAVDGLLKAMRDTIIAAPGRAGLIVKHRLIGNLNYFLRADENWTRDHLITPLMSENVEALALWRAIARQTHFNKVLTIIGSAMTERATDPRLGRETRQSLVFSLVIECLNSLRDARTPAVPYARIQQMIRTIDDEVRAHGANAIQRYVRDVSAKSEDDSTPPSAEELFRLAARPFLQQVWPQEQSLSAPGTSRAFADLPATARDAFAEAVDTIERFLVPFECWSMLDYGLYGDEDGEPKLANIDNAAKASAFLRLLHRTIGTTETSTIPMDLGEALNQVRKVAPSLVETPIFRRLATAARRV